MPAPELSIVIPCLNEAESLPFCLEKANSFLLTNNIDGEVIVADNGSTDDSVQIALQNQAKVIHVTEKGYGNAVLGGIENAAGKYIIMGDADDSYDFSNLMPFVTLLRNGYDFVNGNRFKGKIQKSAMPFLHRYLGTPILNFIARIFFSIKVRDFHCGLRGFVRESVLKLDLRSTGMEFSTEMIVKASLANLKMTEIPVTLYPDKRNRSPHLRTWRDGWRHLRFLLLYCPRWLFLFPGLFLLVLGFIGSLVLIPGSVIIGTKKLDVHTLVYTSSFIIIGFQFVAFYFFTRLYAITHGLLPASERFLAMFKKHFHLERGLLTGLVLVVGGIFLMIKSFLYWEKVHFGNLDPIIVLRWVIPSSVLIILGLQVIITSFYLSFLTIKSKY